MKKILSIIITLAALLFCGSTTVFADEPTLVLSNEASSDVLVAAPEDTNSINEEENKLDNCEEEVDCEEEAEEEVEPQVWPAVLVGIVAVIALIIIIILNCAGR